MSPLSRRLSFVLSPLLFSVAVSAQVQTFKDWNLAEEAVDAELKVPVCRAWTGVVKGLETPAELSLSIPKEQDRFPIVVMKIVNPAEKPASLIVRISSKESMAFFLVKEAANPGEPDLYWYAPLNQPRLIEKIAELSSLQVVLDPKSETPKAFQVSLAGSSSTLKKTETCAKVSDLSPKEFLSFMNAKIEKTDTVPQELTGAALATNVQRAFQIYLQSKKTQADLVELRKSMKTLLDQEAKATSVLNDRQKKLDSVTAEARKNRAKLTDLETQAATEESELVSLTAIRQQAEADRNAKKAAFDPVREQIAPLVRDVERRKSVLEEAESAISYHRSRISSAQSEIDSLQSRARSLESHGDSLRSRIRSLDSDKSRVESELFRYDIGREARQIIESDWRYRSLRQDAERAQQEARQLQGESQRARQDVDSARSALNSCQAQAGADCSAQQRELDSKQNALRDLERRADQARNRAEQARREMDRIERDAHHQAERGRDELVRRRENLANEIRGLQNQVDQTDDEIRRIVQSEIPSRESAISDSRSRLPGLERDRANAQSDLRSAQNRLATAKAQLDHDRLEKEYRDAQSVLSRAVKNQESKESDLASTRRQIARLQPTVAKLESDVVVATSARDQAAQALAAVQEQLVPQRAQESDLLTVLNGLHERMTAYRSDYQQIYDHLVKSLL